MYVTSSMPVSDAVILPHVERLKTRSAATGCPTAFELALVGVSAVSTPLYALRDLDFANRRRFSEEGQSF
jgi:hypothetical protein